MAAHVLVRQGRYDDAASALQNAIDIARTALGNQHQAVAIYTLNLASVQLKRNEPEEAEALAREGLRIRGLAPGLVPARRRIVVEDDWSIEATNNLLAATLAAQAKERRTDSTLRN